MDGKEEMSRNNEVKEHAWQLDIIEKECAAYLHYAFVVVHLKYIEDYRLREGVVDA